MKRSTGFWAALFVSAIMLVDAGFRLHDLSTENEALRAQVEEQKLTIADLEADKAKLQNALVNARMDTARVERLRVRATAQLDEATTERRKIENYLSVKYEVSHAEASVLAEHFYDAAERAEKRYGVEIDMTVLAAMGHTESRFRPNAVSWAGAVGIMQVVPRYHLERYSFLERREDLLVPRLNIRAGTFIFAEGLARYGDTRAAIRAYHGGARGVANPRPSTVAYERTIYERLQQLRVRA